MHHINCPYCGYRDEAEFQYQGDATVQRPKQESGKENEKEFFHYVYMRENPKGWHIEWWHHIGGCRQWIKVVRNTFTHEIYKTATAQEKLELPNESTAQ